MTMDTASVNWDMREFDDFGFILSIIPQSDYVMLFTARKGGAAKLLQVALGACVIPAVYGYSQRGCPFSRRRKMRYCLADMI